MHLTRPSAAADLARLADVAERARDYARAARAASTLRAYRADWGAFAVWCADRRLAALPAAAETVALYVADLGGQRKPATIARRLAAIAEAHKAAGRPSPTADAAVKTVWSGVRRTHGTAQVGKTPAVTADVRAMVTTLPDRLIGHRDRALLLLGFAGAFRRAELVGLDVADVAETADGLVVTLRRSKTDQEGEGRKIGVPYGSNPATCPVRALRTWLEVAAIADGSLFRRVDRHGRLLPGRLGDRAVALAVKRAAAAAGLDPAGYAGHSLRAGLATAAAAANVPERVIALQTGHKSMAVLRRYIREGSLFRENAAAAVGL